MHRRDDISSVGTGSEASPTTQRKRDLDILIDSQAHTSMPGDPPLLPGELLSYIEHKITYLDHFLGAIEGTVFITSYKLFFRSEPNPHNSAVSVIIE
jgi:myotubularin-related protein 1/2